MDSVEATDKFMPFGDYLFNVEHRLPAPSVLQQSLPHVGPGGGRRVGVQARRKVTAAPALQTYKKITEQEMSALDLKDYPRRILRDRPVSASALHGARGEELLLFVMDGG